MKNTKHLVILLSIFFIWGAFFVNLPAGNYIFMIYDIFLAIVVPLFVYNY